MPATTAPLPKSADSVENGELDSIASKLAAMSITPTNTESVKLFLNGLEVSGGMTFGALVPRIFSLAGTEKGQHIIEAMLEYFSIFPGENYQVHYIDIGVEATIALEGQVVSSKNLKRFSELKANGWKMANADATFVKFVENEFEKLERDLEPIKREVFISSGMEGDVEEKIKHGYSALGNEILSYLDRRRLPTVEFNALNHKAYDLVGACAQRIINEIELITCGHGTRNNTMHEKKIEFIRIVARTFGSEEEDIPSRVICGIFDELNKCSEEKYGPFRFQRILKPMFTDDKSPSAIKALINSYKQLQKILDERIFFFRS